MFDAVCLKEFQQRTAVSERVTIAKQRFWKLARTVDWLDVRHCLGECGGGHKDLG